jgi:hypothetical protein
MIVAMVTLWLRSYEFAVTALVARDNKCRVAISATTHCADSTSLNRVGPSRRSWRRNARAVRFGIWSHTRSINASVEPVSASTSTFASTAESTAANVDELVEINPRQKLARGGRSGENTRGRGFGGDFVGRRATRLDKLIDGRRNVFCARVLAAQLVPNWLYGGTSGLELLGQGCITRAQISHDLVTGRRIGRGEDGSHSLVAPHATSFMSRALSDPGGQLILQDDHAFRIGVTERGQAINRLGLQFLGQRG